MEVCGGTSCGKSTVILHAIVATVLPSTCGGCQKSVVLLDNGMRRAGVLHSQHDSRVPTDSKFDVLRLTELLEHRISVVTSVSSVHIDDVKVITPLHSDF